MAYIFKKSRAAENVLQLNPV